MVGHARVPGSRFASAVVAMALAIVPVLSGCPDSSPPPPFGSDPGRDTSTGHDASTGHDTSTDRETPELATCTGGIDCPQGLVCDTAARACVECLRDSDCPKGFICDAQECVAGTA